MTSNTPPIKSYRPKLTQFRIDEIREHDDDNKTGWLKRIRQAARGSARKSEVQQGVQEERLGPRPVSRRVRAPSKSSVPILDIDDDVLDRLTGEPSTLARRPTSKFFEKQRRRAGHSEQSGSSKRHTEKRKLDAEDIISIFAGAPYFNVEDDAGRRQPRVVYGWDPTTADDRDLTDYIPPRHKSFAVRSLDERSAVVKTQRRAREVPSMLSADGKDAGTVGFTHFLELPLAQSYHLDEQATSRQHLLVSDPELLGLRTFDIENVVDRLSELSNVYEMLCSGRGEATDWDQRMIEEIGEDLFTTLLNADLGTTPAGTGSVSLFTQITALQKVLSAQNAWFDFSNEQWRTHLGQIMWQPRDIISSKYDTTVNERDILMLQIALGAELAVRLEIASRLAAHNFRIPAIYAPDDFQTMLNAQTEKLDWDITVFKRFNQVFETTSKPHGTLSPMQRLSFVEAADSISPPLQEPDLVFQLRMEQQQWDGLHTFASSLNWPGLDNAKVQPALSKFDSFMTPPINERPDSYVSEYDTPLSSPADPSPDVSQGTPALILVRSLKTLYTHSAFEEVSPTPSQSVNLSWIAKSWLSGFIMPGASVNQFLLHTLLETNAEAESLLAGSLGSNDGFVHQRQMYWSKESVVGRVLASSTDAKECSGWISLPFVPQETGDGWIHTMVADAPYAFLEPRINAPDLVSRTSDPLHSYDPSKLQWEDFTTVVDGDLVVGNEAQFHGVSLSSSNDDNSIPRVVCLSFKSPRNPKFAPLTLPLIHAVYFVSSSPCYPYTIRNVASVSSPAHDSQARTDSGRSTPMSSPTDKDLPPPPAHPLHVDYTYTIIPGAALLSSEIPELKGSDALILLDSLLDDSPSVYRIDDQEVIVLDCRGSSDLEVLARAWCSKIGENGLIGHADRTCLACCIREAAGLGIGVVIRTS